MTIFSNYGFVTPLTGKNMGPYLRTFARQGSVCENTFLSPCDTGSRMHSEQAPCWDFSSTNCHTPGFCDT